MKNNNGKVAIAIVAMFVVALSVVGFTYAYFTAQVQGNSEDKSVQVQGGIMQVDYDFGRKLSAVDIVPGWISDDFHYYDPVLSSDLDGDVRKISSEVLPAKDTLAAESGYTKIEEIAGLRSKPVSFTVTNTGDNVAKYAINLNVNNFDHDNNEETSEILANTFDGSVDKENLLVYLIPGEWDDSKAITEEFLEDYTAIKVFNDDGTAKNIIQLSAYEELGLSDTDKTQSYYVVLYYKNSNTDAQNANMGKTFVASVEIVGLGQHDTKPITGN